jgi:hypothetical protein
MKLQNLLFVGVIFFVMVMAACGGGGMQAPPVAPTFTSIPGTAAAEGTVYAYQIAATDPTGGAVSFALASGPAGATVSGNTLTWTPTPEESRTADSFRITATTAEGGTASQAWSVTPVGTVRISRVDTFWSVDGSITLPFDWTKSPWAVAEVAALVPQADGTFQKLTGTGSSDGTFAIPNVPSGYYWLRISPDATYWTSTSNFDFGGNIVGPKKFSVTPGVQRTTIDLSVSGLDPWATGDLLDFVPNSPLGFAAAGPIPPGATSGTVGQSLMSNIDFSAITSAQLMQYEPLQIGSLSALSLGAEGAVSNLSISNGATNNISGTLSASPKSSLNLNIQGSAWATLFNNAAPGAVTPYDTAFGMTAQFYYTGGLPRPGPLFGGGGAATLFGTTFAPGPFVLLGGGLPLPGCSDIIFVTDSSILPIMAQPPILTDQNLGAFQYGDPFPQSWIRPFEYCQRGLVRITEPGTSTPITFVLTDGQHTAAPTGPVTPIMGTVQNPMINGQSLFTANTLSTNVVNLSWTAPNSQVAPAGYVVQLFVRMTLPGGTAGFGTFGRITTAKTSATLPYPLAAGQGFFVTISAEADGHANFETSPMRSSLPTASAGVISAWMTMSGSTPALARENSILFKPTPYVVTVPQPANSRQVTLPTQE